jgi:hypothetical protein
VADRLIGAAVAKGGSDVGGGDRNTK